ncbi:MAG TPA: hypothetical protein VLL77_03055 [Anaerolineales bacterium]|nr:hypothetical protein [Anaerolineales bacterium]
MESKTDRTIWWVAAAVLLGLLCCLCVVVIGTGASIWMAADGGFATAPPLIPTLAPTPEVPDSSWGARDVPPEAEAMEFALRSVIVPVSDPIDLAERLEGKQGIPRVLAESAAPIPLGTVERFWATNNDGPTNFQVDAELAYATDHVYFWIERGVDYDFGELKQLVDEFEAGAYPTNREFFGSEWSPGVDGDPHLYILLAGGLGSTVAGYYSPGDEYSSLAREYSNGHEMFYLNADNTDLGREYTAATLAHEFQHMIHWILDRNEDIWLNEGFSMVSEHLNGFDVGGHDYVYADRPDQTLSNWPGGNEDSSGHYGQAFLILTYFLDRFGPEATQSLVAHAANGFDSIDQTLTELGAIHPDTGAGLSADDVFLDWALALLIQDPDVADGRFAYVSYPTAPRPAYAETVQDCPVTDETRSVGQFGVDYIRITCPGDYRIAVEGTPLVTILPEGAKSGDYAFWSNRGDDSNMTLTRTFDLSDVTGPVALEYWLWYDLEEGWDYAYLVVSDDGGQTWSILETPSGTAEDPSGNSYGWGWNARSGGGEEPEWIQERVDLSAFAGKEILVRFEYVTDAAVNGEGLMVDDIRIDAIGYGEDFESGDGGWEAAGFVRLYNLVPQTYRAALVERGDETKVTYLTPDAEGRLTAPLRVGGATDEAILVITGTARRTWQPAIYRYSLTPGE